MSPTSDPSTEETARLERAVSVRRAQYRAYNRSEKGLARYHRYNRSEKGLARYHRNYDKLVATVEGRGRLWDKQLTQTRARRRERIAAHDERITCRS